MIEMVGVMVHLRDVTTEVRGVVVTETMTEAQGGGKMTSEDHRLRHGEETDPHHVKRHLKIGHGDLLADQITMIRRVTGWMDHESVESGVAGMIGIEEDLQDAVMIHLKIMATGESVDHHHHHHHGDVLTDMNVHQKEFALVHQDACHRLVVVLLGVDHLWAVQASPLHEAALLWDEDGPPWDREVLLGMTGDVALLIGRRLDEI